MEPGEGISGIVPHINIIKSFNLARICFKVASSVVILDDQRARSLQQRVLKPEAQMWKRFGI